MTGEELDIAVRSHVLHGQRFGARTAPLVIGLHGLTLNMRAFDFLGERLGSDLQLVAIDLRGRGKSDRTAAGTYGWENHALDVLAIAEALGFERFAVVGQSMGGAIAMKAAELDPDRLEAVVLVDIAGRVDRGAGELVASIVATVHDEHDSVDDYIDGVRRQGLVEPWTDHWDRCHRYGTEEVGGRVRASVDPIALAEDRAYGAAHGAEVYERWRHLTMPALLVRATKELRPGTGHVVPADDCASFLRDVPHATVVEVDANHLTVNAHPDTAVAVHRFLVAHTG